MFKCMSPKRGTMSQTTERATSSVYWRSRAIGSSFITTGSMLCGGLLYTLATVGVFTILCDDTQTYGPYTIRCRLFECNWSDWCGPDDGTQGRKCRRCGRWEYEDGRTLPGAENQ